MKLAAIVLAAGSAKRFGSDKLSAEFHGEPLLHHAIRTARAAPVEKVVVATRPGLKIGTWEGPPAVDRIDIDSDALSASLKAGIAAAQGVEGAFIFLGDMPLVPHEIAGKLAAQIGDNYAAIPRHEGRSGHPVLLSSQSFEDIATLEGDQGAGKLLKQRSDIAFLNVDEPGIVLDIDRPEDLTGLSERLPRD